MTKKKQDNPKKETEPQEKRPPMAKTVVSLPEPALQWLKDESDRLGISLAELVRRAIDDYRHKWERE